MEDKSSEAEMAPVKKGKICRLLAATVGAVAIAAPIAANLTDIIELLEKVSCWNSLEDNNEIVLENISSTTLSSDFNKPGSLESSSCEMFRQRVHVPFDFAACDGKVGTYSRFKYLIIGNIGDT